MSQNNTENNYFDLTAEGLGYLNRARKVSPNQGSPYHCVTIAALHGQSDNPNYTYFDCRIVGSDALAFVTERFDMINDRDTKVLVRFKVGDMLADSYETQGKSYHVIKSRLLRITWAKIGDTVIDLGLDDADEPASQSETPSQAPVASAGCSGNQQVQFIHIGDKQQPAATQVATEAVTQFGEVVYLEKDAPNFKEMRNKLKDLGYRWDVDTKGWFSPEKFEQMKNVA